MGTALIIAAIVTAIAASAQTAAVLQQKKQDKANAKIAEANAREAMRHAENIDLQADQERLQLRLKAQQAAGKQRASTAASGIMLGSGTSSAQAADLASAFDLDMKNLNYDIASRVWQQQMKSAEFQNQANKLKTNARNSGRKIAYIWGKAVGSWLLGWGAGAVAGSIAQGAKASADAVAAAQAAGVSIGMAAGETSADLLAANQGFALGATGGTDAALQVFEKQGSFDYFTMNSDTRQKLKADAKLKPAGSKSIPSLN